jgi:hypothetical protein
MDGAYRVFQPAALYQALGEPLPDPPITTPGYEPYGNFVFHVNASDLPAVWFDPSVAARSAPVPAVGTDFISIALHEMIHGLGFGYLKVDPWVGHPPGLPPVNVPGSINKFAQDTAFGAGGDPSVLYFTGPTAEAYFGGQPVPLYSVPPSDPTSISNYSHIGGAPGKPGAGLIDVMNQAGPRPGRRYNVSNLDLAILADLGYQILSYPGLANGGSGSGATAVSIANVTSDGPTITIQFNGPVDLVSTSDTSSYSLSLPGKRHKPGQSVAISYTAYNTNTNSVILVLAQPLRKGQRAELVVHGASIFDDSGYPIGGDFNKIVLVSAKKHGRRH